MQKRKKVKLYYTNGKLYELKNVVDISDQKDAVSFTIEETAEKFKRISSVVTEVTMYVSKVTRVKKYDLKGYTLKSDNKLTIVNVRNNYNFSNLMTSSSLTL